MSTLTYTPTTGTALHLPRTPQAVVEDALNAARALRDVRDCVVFTMVDSSADLRWANSTLTTNGVSWGMSITVVAYVDTPTGVATATIGVDSADLDTSRVRSLVEAAVAKARLLGGSGEGMPLLPRQLGNWDELPVVTDASVFAPITGHLGQIFAEATHGDYAHYGYAEHSLVSVWVAALSGLRAQYAMPSGRIEMTARSVDATRSAWEGVSTRTFSGLDLPRLDHQLRTRLEWQRRRVELPAGKYTTILPAGCVGDLVETMRPALVARDAVEGNSFFASANTANGTRLGELITAAGVHLFSDPGYRGLEVPDIVVDLYDSPNASVFDTGLTAGRADWLTDGRLGALEGTRVTETEHGINRAADCGNLVLDIDGGSGTLDDLVAGTDSGVLCTSLWYIRDLEEADLLVTGLTRDGVYLVEGGEVVAATNNFRFNESAPGILSRIARAGATEITQVREHAESADAMAMPPLVIEAFTMSSVSTSN